MGVVYLLRGPLRLAPSVSFEVQGIMKLKLTNKLGLPEPIVQAVMHDPYESGGSDYTATSLLKPARMAQLEREVELEQDASDRLYSLQGQMMHLILERAGDALSKDGYIVETRYMSEFGKFEVSAQIDMFDPKTGILSDYKYTSVWAVKHGLKPEHRMQLNLQAELLRRNGHIVNKAEVVLLLRDWSAERHEGQPVVKQEVDLMSSDEVVAWVEERIKAHEAAKLSLPRCTDEERWSHPTYAVTNGLNVARALRVFDTLPEAQAFVAASGKALEITRRPGRPVRCMRYCPARSVCTQAEEIQVPGIDPETWK
jgi:hypothetical protein